MQWCHECQDYADETPEGLSCGHKQFETTVSANTEEAGTMYVHVECPDCKEARKRIEQLKRELEAMTKQALGFSQRGQSMENSLARARDELEAMTIVVKDKKSDVEALIELSEGLTTRGMRSVDPSSCKAAIKVIDKLTIALADCGKRAVFNEHGSMTVLPKGKPGG